MLSSISCISGTILDTGVSCILYFNRKDTDLISCESRVIMVDSDEWQTEYLGIRGKWLVEDRGFQT